MPVNQNEIQVLHKHLIESLSGEKAHTTFDKVVEEFPLEAINKKVHGIPHSPWYFLAHMPYSGYLLRNISADFILLFLNDYVRLTIV